MERAKDRAKTLWRLVKNNLIYDLLKTAATYLLPWIVGIVGIGIFMLRAYIISQPPGFFAMLLVFVAAFFLTAVALQKKYQPEPNLQFSRRKLSAVAALIFLGVPVVLFVLSRIPVTRDDGTEIASPQQHDPVSPKVEEPKIEKPKNRRPASGR